MSTDRNNRYNRYAARAAHEVELWESFSSLTPALLFMNTITSEPESTTACTPKFVNDPAYRCLRVGDIAGFNHYSNEEELVDLSGADLRGVDLRKADLRKVILRGAYLKDADLRGQDLRNVDLEGCSIRNAKVGGCYFPDALRAEEIIMSIQHGTRLRMSN